jgi:hypothetical protein
MKVWKIWALLLAATIFAFAVAWEQPDCAASMACRSTKTLPEYFETLLGLAPFCVFVTDTEHIFDEVMRTMYSEADPPLDWDEARANPDEKDEDWYLQHELSQERQEEIFDTVVDDYDLLESERSVLATACLLEYAPTTPDEGDVTDGN